MKSIINRRGSKAVTRAFKCSGRSQREVSPGMPTLEAKSVHRCDTCDNVGWTTMDKVAACNCCDEGEFYTPQKSQAITPK